MLFFLLNFREKCKKPAFCNLDKIFCSTISVIIKISPSFQKRMTEIFCFRNRFVVLSMLDIICAGKDVEGTYKVVKHLLDNVGTIGESESGI